MIQNASNALFLSDVALAFTQILPPQAAQGHAATLRAILWQSPGVDNSGTRQNKRRCRTLGFV